MSVNHTSSDSSNAYKLPAIFSLEGLKVLQLGANDSTDANRRYLAHHVKRYPLDLRVQVQRILINQDQGHLSGALQDLFIALKDNGLKLRQMVYSRVQAHLVKEEQDFFSNWLEKGYDESYNDRFIEGSVLSIGLVSKGLPLLSLSTKASSSYTSHYQEAVDCLEYGQLEVAQELLEQEMLNPEGDSRTEEELLRVYSYTKDYESKERLLALLMEQGRELSPDWKLSNTKEG
ncbi:hypothetical protein [Leucothrix arctica]|uniref:Uncharacterized protein n=1 Tax=Leucothrix arctica TaxID=1481894 RepID=A0A317C6J6_9GAMM|nr:hypothetical protein [Leucothrix arctica]PWQ93909.1 hypothetical protein DKT75_20120 [Leucothrix arctica]